MPQEVIISQGTGTVFSAIDDMYNFAMTWNTHFYKSENIQKFIKSTEHQFDIIVAEEFFIDSFLYFAYKHNAPVVTICKCCEWNRSRTTVCVFFQSSIGLTFQVHLVIQILLTVKEDWFHRQAMYHIG